MMELKQYDGFLVSHQRQGYDKNGNPIYIINVFEHYNSTGVSHYGNVNGYTAYKLDKYGNIKTTTFNVEHTIYHILSTLKKVY